MQQTRGNDLLRWLVIALGVIVLVVLLFGLLGGWTMWPGMMGWGGFGFGWWGVLMMLLMVVFWAAVIGGVVLLVLWLVQQARPAVGPGPGSARPLDILRERYARGELTREQYEQMRRDLEESG